MACVGKWQAKFQWYKSQQQPGASLAQGLHQHVVKTKADRLNLKHFDPFLGHFFISLKHLSFKASFFRQNLKYR
ncbi:hypothetical protein PRUPE_8G007300 [Prunus persica]|uniref:Uncharacterized protein n=1 Tax=Prunus persica TaxID=3760 RepID=A0A251MTQ8_PRUPE|nr:hypothetical protein PRUPE_8G007300 [Prunus persica]